MTFTNSELLKIGRLFSGRDGEHDTIEIAQIMGRSEGEIYSALSDARDAYREFNGWHREHQQSVRDKARAAT